MRGIFLAFLVLLSSACFAQDSTRFDKIIIEYFKGHNSWGDPGVYSSGERFVLLPKNTSNYKIDAFEKIEFNAGDDGKTYTKDTTIVPIRARKIPKAKIDSLFAALNTTKDNFRPQFIRPLLNTPSKSQIIKGARDINKEYRLDEDDKDSFLAHINKIKKFDEIDSFIDTSRPLSGSFYTGVTDAWNTLIIRLIKKADTVKFNLDFFRPLGQPVDKITRRPKLAVSQSTNIQVNQLLEEILPAGSKAKTVVEIKAFTDDYIKWYIDKKL